MAVPPYTYRDGWNADAPLSSARRRFFEEHFRPAYFDRAPLDVGADDGYVYQLWMELVQAMPSDVHVAKEIRRLLRTYRYPRWHIADTYYLEGDFAAGFESWGISVNEPLYVNLASAVGHPRLDALTVLYWSGNYITSRGIRGLGDVIQRLQEALDTFHDAHGISIIEDCWATLAAAPVTDDLISEVVGYAAAEVDSSEVREILEESLVLDGRTSLAFRGVPGVEVPFEWPAPWVRMGRRGRLLRLRCRHLIRSAENAHRAEAGVPLVGQGWVSEMTLFRELQETFPSERIVHQARPAWLGRQSLDIFFPDRLVAVEYQGAQHSRPVKFFGGGAAFDAQRERDATKRALCRTEGCELIEVYPGYSLSEVVASIETAFARHADPA